MDMQRVPQRASPFAHEFDNQVVVYNETQRKVLVLNELGGAIWDLLDGRRNIAAICGEIAGHLEAERATVERDVCAFLEEMERHGLVSY